MLDIHQTYINLYELICHVNRYDLGDVIQGDLAEPEPEVPELLQQMAQKDWRNQWNKLVQLVQMDLASSVRTFEILCCFVMLEIQKEKQTTVEIEGSKKKMNEMVSMGELKSAEKVSSRLCVVYEW